MYSPLDEISVLIRIGRDQSPLYQKEKVDICKPEKVKSLGAVSDCTLILVFQPPEQ